MATRKSGPPPRPKTSSIKTLRAKLAALEKERKGVQESLDAIRSGAVDALVIKGPQGDQIYTLKDADRPYRAVLEQMRDGAVTIRENGLILYANRQFAAMLGLPLENVLGGDLFALAGPQGRADLQVLISAAGGDGASGDVEFTSNRGRPLLVRLSLAPIKIEGGQILAGVAADMTNERLSNQKIRQMERTEALGRLAGGVAHDLNNILQPILINAELLADETEPASPKRELLRNIIEAASRQKDLVKRILSFTRQTKNDLRPLAMTPLVAEAVNMLAPSLPKGLDIHLTAESIADVIQGDPTELHELVTNLCTNAADAMGVKGGTVEISLRDIALTRESARFDLQPGRYLKLAVKDTGCGIPPEDLERVFDPFFTTKETGRGTGIGLSVVQGIVKSHGGSITIESQVGRGTEVTVFLPVAETREFGAHRPAQDWRRVFSNRRILLVDDEGMVLETMRRALASFGHKPTALRDPREALALLRTLPRHFDLAIIDQRMPKMSGLDLAGEIRKINQDLPILLATGYSKAVDDLTLQEVGVTAVVMKPFSLRDLAAAVNRALETGPRQP